MSWTGITSSDHTLRSNGHQTSEAANMHKKWSSSDRVESATLQLQYLPTGHGSVPPIQTATVSGP